MNVFKKIIYIAFLTISIKASGQLSYGNEQFLFNPVLINPSLAGLHNGQAQLGYDARWLGVDGAPRTSFLRFDKMFNGNTGWDIAVISDRVGPISSISVSNAFAYHLRITENTNLSFGLRHHLTQNYFNINPQLLIDQNDPLLLSEQT
jgi:type IX secretion system PorP/SprF family membrane protein